MHTNIKMKINSSLFKANLGNSSTFKALNSENKIQGFHVAHCLVCYMCRINVVISTCAGQVILITVSCTSDLECGRHRDQPRSRPTACDITHGK